MKSNRWEDPYNRSSADRAEENRTVTTSRLLGMRQNTDNNSTVKKVNETEKFAAAMEMRNGRTNATGHNTIMHGGVKSYGQSEVQATYINGNKGVPMVDSC